jgi:phage terminase small subunit
MPLNGRVVDDMSLTARQIRFCNEYLIDFNGTKAALRAGYSENGAGQTAFLLLKNDEIAARIEERKEELAAAAGIDASWVLNQWRMIAQADPNELIQNRRVNCRHCWGVQHRFQWTQNEYLDAVNRALTMKPPAPPPDGLGGFGFDRTRGPNTTCPECRGEGFEDIFVADTNKLTGSARRLYAGLKKTKDGIEIKMRDQDGALASIAKYLGMVIDKKELAGPGGGPVRVANIQATDLTDDQLAAIIAGDDESPVDDSSNKE